MGIHNNTPNFTWISIKGLNIQKGDKFYSVSDIKTEMEHLYWELDNPTVLRPSNMNLGTTGTRYLLYRNNSGEVIEVPNDELVITYSDGEGNPVFEEKVISITEKLDDSNKKIVQLEQNMDGFKQTVGDWKVSADGTIKENITKIVQTNKNIDLKVQDVTKSFNENKAIDDLKQKFIKSVLDFNSQIGITDSLLYSYYKDKVITDEEEKNIQSLLSLLDVKRSDVILQTNEFIKLAESNKQTTQKDAMISERNKYDDSVTNLINYVKTAITDRVTTTIDITGMVSSMSKCSTTVNSLKDTVNDFLFLGSGGKIIDEMARIGIKSNELTLQVSSTEELVKTALGIEKNLLQSQISDFKTASEDLKYKIGIYSPDGVSDEDEQKSINDAITKVLNERNDISTKYNSIYNNQYLTTNGKNKIKSKYDLFVVKSDECMRKIHDYFADGFINDIEVNDSYVLINDSYSLLLELGTQLGFAIDEIDDETKKAELQAVKDSMQKEVDEVGKEVINLNNYVDGTFKNNVIDDGEKKMLKETLKAFTTEKIDIDNTYTQLHSSKYLDGLKKTQFEQEYTLLNSKYKALIDTYNGIINKTNLISNSDRTNLTKAESDFNIELCKFKLVSNAVIEYINDKSSAELKSEFDSQITGLDKKVTGMQIDIENTISDNLIDGSEKITLNSNLELLYNDYAKAETEYIKIRDNKDLEDVFKKPMSDAFNDMALKFGLLVSLIDYLVNKDNEILDTEKTQLKDDFTNYRKAKEVYTNTVYNSIDAIKNKSITDMQTALNKEINDVNKAVNDLETNMITVFKDGVLSDSEKLSLKQNLQNIQKDKIDVDNGYNSLYPNADLLDPAKVNLKNAYNDYISKYTELVKQTSNIINKVGIIDGTDKSAFETAYSNFKNTSGIYTKRVNESLESIANRKKALAENNSRTYADAQIKVVKEEISSKVSRIDYDENNKKLSENFTKINQTANIISLRVTDIQNDYTTSSELKQTKDDFEFKFENSGMPNELINSDFKELQRGWNVYQEGNTQAWVEYSPNFSGEEVVGTHCMYLSNSNAIGGLAYANQTFKPRNPRMINFTVSGCYHYDDIRTHTEEPYPLAYIYVVIVNKDGTREYYNQDEVMRNNQYIAWRTYHTTFGRIGKEIDFIEFHVFKRSTTGTFRITNLDFHEGTEHRKWRPSGEIYSNTTKVDGEGVRVYHNNGDYTQMSADGMKRYRSSGDAKGEYHYLTHYAGFTTTGGTSDYVWVQLPDDFRGKNFTAYSVMSDTWDDSWNWGEPWVLQRFVTFVETSRIDYANARVPIRGYRTDKNYSTGERRTRPVAGILLVIA